jgi:hypothetical protein
MGGIPQPPPNSVAVTCTSDAWASVAGADVVVLGGGVTGGVTGAAGVAGAVGAVVEGAAVDPANEPPERLALQPMTAALRAKNRRTQALLVLMPPRRVTEA